MEETSLELAFDFNTNKREHDLEFSIEQQVYLKTDQDQKPFLVTGIQLRPCNSVTYAISSGTSESWHYGLEISAVRNIVMATSH